MADELVAQVELDKALANYRQAVSELKNLRATMAKIADSQDFKMPATIDDPAILDEIRVALQAMGYAK